MPPVHGRNPILNFAMRIASAFDGLATIMHPFKVHHALRSARNCNTLQQVPIFRREISHVSFLFFRQVGVHPGVFLAPVLRVARNSINDAGNDAQDGESNADGEARDVLWPVFSYIENEYKHLIIMKDHRTYQERRRPR